MEENESKRKPSDVSEKVSNLLTHGPLKGLDKENAENIFEFIRKLKQFTLNLYPVDEDGVHPLKDMYRLDADIRKEKETREIYIPISYRLGMIDEHKFTSPHFMNIEFVMRVGKRADEHEIFIELVGENVFEKPREVIYCREGDIKQQPLTETFFEEVSARAIAEIKREQEIDEYFLKKVYADLLDKVCEKYKLAYDDIALSLGININPMYEGVYEYNAEKKAYFYKLKLIEN